MEDLSSVAALAARKMAARDLYGFAVEAQAEDAHALQHAFAAVSVSAVTAVSCHENAWWLQKQAHGSFLLALLGTGRQRKRLIPGRLWTCSCAS